MDPKWTEIVTAIVAVLGVGGGIVSYSLRTRELASKNSLDKFHNYTALNALYEEDSQCKAIRDAAGGHTDWSEVDDGDRFGFMAIYEQIALMLQSGLLSEDVAFYSYGYNLLKAYRDPNFWNNVVRKDDKYWELTLRLFDRFERYEDRYKGKSFPVEEFQF